MNDDDSSGSEGDYYEPPFHVWYPKEDMGVFRSVIRNNPCCEDPDRWIELLEQGSEVPHITLLLISLTNLTTLTFECLGSDHDIIDRAIKYIVQHAVTGALADLKNLNLHFTDATDLEDLFSSLRIFLALPSISNISVKGILPSEDEHVFEVGWSMGGTLATKLSQVQNLSFENCEFDPKTMFEFLGNLEDLQTFTYLDPRETDAYFDAFWLRSALLAHARSSLRSLTVRALGNEGSSLGSLRKFQVLRKLEISLELLSTYNQSWPAGYLPTSIEEVGLHFSKNNFDR